ncbi:MAG TPA: discoidin domain-containing protein, partial [Thermomicrobiales bacterium]|nr:discoidin domain-containing protein [Thermomicrobiales bacterium]
MFGLVTPAARSLASGRKSANASGPHRYWRVFVDLNNGEPTATSIVELEMYEEILGQNQCVGGAASASSVYSPLSTPPVASRAFDGNLSDYSTTPSVWSLWAGATGANEWLAYDFGAGNAKEIVQIGMWGRQSARANQMPNTFRVQCSDDGAHWATAWSESGITWSAWEFKRFTRPSAARSYTGSPHGAHMYWQLVSIQSDGAGLAGAAAEVQFRATPGGANQATGGTASASSEYSATYAAAKAFDGNAATLWATANGVAYSTLTYQFATAVEVAEASLTARSDGFANTTPAYTGWCYSDDGTHWTTAWRDQQSGWSLGETRILTDP